MATLRLLAAVLMVFGWATAAMAVPAARASRWTETLAETAELLANQEVAKARDRLSKLTREMADAIVSAGDADRLFADALAQLAVAEAGSGETDDAIWHWQIAQNIDPGVRSTDLSRYGKHAEVLLRNNLPPAPEKCTRPVNAPSPAVLKRVEPRYPKAAREVPVSGVVIVELHLDVSGRRVMPLVLRSPLSVLTYSTLVALREWRFETPAGVTERAAPFCRLFSFGRH